MYVLLKSLSQINFRNLSTPRLEFGPGITAVIGPNASGKSNLLDAIYLGVSGELPGSKIAEVLRIGESEGFVSVRLERQDGVIGTEIGLSPGRKVLRLDGQTVRALELARVSAAVLITPEDTELVHGAPASRRAYLDQLLSKLSLRYGLLLREYNRVVEQRNASLKQGFDPTLEVWTERFLELGGEIADLRRRALKRVQDVAAATYGEIAGDGKALSVQLQSEDEATLEEALERSRAEERARGMTVVGPHRDDLLLLLGGHSLQAYGSRGEARTASLALRVAEYQLLLAKHGEAPVLLLDDFTAELDADRRAYLLELAASTPQAIVTGTEKPPQCQALLTVSGGSFRGG